MALNKAKLTKKQIEELWGEFRTAIKSSTYIDESETTEQQKKRIKHLEANPEEWFVHYFPGYSYAEPAKFHKDATKRILNNPEWYEVRSWSRELAKSTRTMFELLYLALTGKKKYITMNSSESDAAATLLEPYRVALDSNQRIINDYGIQEAISGWKFGDFKTRGGVKFKSFGTGNKPRGTRNNEIRPDAQVFDDMDTDEACRNKDMIDKAWHWIENAAIGTRSISKPTLIIFCGNVIAIDCCVVRAQAYADHVDIINIRDENGFSSWPQKNTEENIDRVLSQKSYNSQQREYFNNPIEAGETFDKMKYGKTPPLSKCEVVVIYADPSPSNRDKPSKRSKASNSCKAVTVVGYYNFKHYLYKCWVDVTNNAKFVDWLYMAEEYCIDAKLLFILIENNTLQGPHFEQVLMPLINAKGKERGKIMGVKGDDRTKPDKFFRVEGTLQPEHSAGRLILNEDEKGDPHMIRMDAQFISVSPNSKTMDGPDAVEGAVHIIKSKLVNPSTKMKIGARQQNKQRF